MVEESKQFRSTIVKQTRRTDMSSNVRRIEVPLEVQQVRVPSRVITAVRRRNLTGVRLPPDSTSMSRALHTRMPLQSSLRWFLIASQGTRRTPSRSTYPDAENQSLRTLLTWPDPRAIPAKGRRRSEFMVENAGTHMKSLSASIAEVVSRCFFFSPEPNRASIRCTNRSMRDMKEVA